MSSEADGDTPVASLSPDQSKQEPPITLTPEGVAFKYQVHMRESDLNRLMRDGHIYIDQGQFRYK